MTEKRGIQADDLYKLASVADPNFSPDGKQVAYVHTTISKENNDYVSNIYVLDIETKKVEQWTFGENRNSSPRWSPDGKYLAFVSNRSGKNQIYILSREGGEAKQVTDVKNGASNLFWSPDGKKLAFTTSLKSGESLYSDEKSDSKNDKKEKYTAVEVTKMKYKMDGLGLYDGKYKQVAILDIASEKVNLLTENERDHNLLGWSANGENLVISANEAEDEDFSFIHDIYLLNIASKEKQNLTNGKGVFYQAYPSPNGKYIAVLGHDRTYENATHGQIWLYNVESGEFKNLSVDWAFPVGDYVAGDFQQNVVYPGAIWTEDCKGIYFTGSHYGSVNLYFTDLEGNVQKITNENAHIFGVSFSSNNRVVATISYPTQPSDLYEIDLNNGSVNQLTSHNEQALKEIELSCPEPISFKSVKDWTVHGWIMKPVNFEEGKKYPLILEVHGGPHAMYANTFFHEMHMLTAQGYVVLYVNPRGSHGYSQEFVNAVRGDYGGNDYSDLMAAVDYALENFDYIDPNRLGVTGGSYGGFMTNWIVGHTNRFKAAVTQRSISNWISFYGVSDIGYYFNEWQHGLEPDDVEGLWKISPIAYVNQIETPLLILHSEEDLRCPMEQAEQLYIALKHRKKQTKLVRFPKSNHELSRSGIPNLRIQRLNYIKDWFNKYL